MFTVCDMVLVNKIDFLSLTDFDMGIFRERVRTLNPGAAIMETSGRTGQGVAAFADWLEREVKAFIA
jgi:hydrogenase nickel incorporation protein HypB